MQRNFGSATSDFKRRFKKVPTDAFQAGLAYGLSTPGTPGLNAGAAVGSLGSLGSGTAFVHPAPPPEPLGTVGGEHRGRRR